MKSFFSRFKNNLNLDFGGRYFEVILAEVVKEEKSLLRILFPSLDGKIIKNDELEIDIECMFPSDSRETEFRISDLVVKYRGKYVALLEIKYEDELREKQLDDYI